MAAVLRKLLFGLKSGGRSKETGKKRSKTTTTTTLSSSSSSLLSTTTTTNPTTTTSTTNTSSSPHNSHHQSNRMCLVSGSGGGHSSAKTHQIVPKSSSETSVSSKTTATTTSDQCATIRSRRLMKEYRELCRISHLHKQNCSNNNNSSGSGSSVGSGSEVSAAASLTAIPFTVELVNDSLHEWHIKVYQFDCESQFYHDMKELGIDYVLLNATFPENYPFAPPFVRVVSPHIEKGFVMEGGAICLELLTRHGWASAYTMEAVIVQLSASFVKGQARIKRNKSSNNAAKEFNKKLAEASFRNVIKIHNRHGWVSPPIFEG